VDKGDVITADYGAVIVCEAGKVEVLKEFVSEESGIKY